MVNLTLSLPDQLYERMQQHRELKWSEIARQAFQKKLIEIEIMEKILKKSKLTEEDAEKIGHKVKAEIRKRFAQAK